MVRGDWELSVGRYKRGGLRFYYTNSGSLRNKMDLLREKVCVEKFDIVAVTETWMDTARKNFLSEFEIAGFQLIHND